MSESASAIAAGSDQRQCRGGEIDELNDNLHDVFVAIPLNSPADKKAFLHSMVKQWSDGGRQNDTIQFISDTTNSRYPVQLYGTTFAAASLLGALSSLLGFLLLERVIESLSHHQIMWYSLIWSAATSFTGYALFASWSNYFYQRELASTQNFSSEEMAAIASVRRLNNNSCFPERHAKQLHRLEQIFAIGVFVGFGTACVMTNIVYGLPLKGVLLSVVIALVWAALIIYFCAFQVNHSFVGLFVACIGTHVVFGLPLHSIALTLLVAVAWLTIALYASFDRTGAGGSDADADPTRSNDEEETIMVV